MAQESYEKLHCATWAKFNFYNFFSTSQEKPQANHIENGLTFLKKEKLGQNLNKTRIRPIARI